MRIVDQRVGIDHDVEPLLRSALQPGLRPPCRAGWLLAGDRLAVVTWGSSSPAPQVVASRLTSDTVFVEVRTGASPGQPVSADCSPTTTVFSLDDEPEPHLVRLVSFSSGDVVELHS
ncbi:hypothetical protein [Blastococcus sp. PRF04-17]|uniref:hypothetical protein n=1 Tax=Blastococcus sp. PRF04-17 TaxID=2933797 RepID=UPI001FF49394|nr:hypothetical protein [Blastococcus sp. PRF04-17]UOY01280.1 hypothetical protein MVA48_20395 [Blastococcus sp. PRF04-17]